MLVKIIPQTLFRRLKPRALCLNRWRSPTNEASFKNTIRTAISDSKTGENDKENQTNESERDYWKINELNTFYKPKYVLDKLKFLGITVRDTYVTHLYSYGELLLNFAWFRPFDPDTFWGEHLNDVDTEIVEKTTLSILLQPFTMRPGL